MGCPVALPLFVYFAVSGGSDDKLAVYGLGCFLFLMLVAVYVTVLGKRKGLYKKCEETRHRQIHTITSMTDDQTPQKYVSVSPFIHPPNHLRQLIDHGETQVSREISHISTQITCGWECRRKSRKVGRIRIRQRGSGMWGLHPTHHSPFVTAQPTTT